MGNIRTSFAIQREKITPAVPATTELRYEDTFQFHRPDSAGGEDYHSGALRPHLTKAKKTGLKNLLDGLFAKANGE